jgi:FkbH-like protein
MSLLQLRLRWRSLVRSNRPIQTRVAILATFTANPLEPYLGVALEDAGLPSEIFIGPYNQAVQECLSDQSQTSRFGPQVVIVWPRFEELWGGRPLPLGESAADYSREAVELAEAAVAASRRWQATLIFVLPAIPEQRPLGVGDACNDTGVFATAARAREALRQRLAGQPGVLIADAEEAVRAIGAEKAYDWRLMISARIPFSEEAFSVIGGRMARLILLSRRPARKVVVVDADNTLWGGTVGEDGPHGIDLRDNDRGEAYRDFQGFLLELRRAGALLAVCSKNDEADVWEAFARREMRLKREHLAAWRINWRAKSLGVREIAEELKLGLDSFVMIDDNPAEIAEAQGALPELACVRMPDDPADWLRVIQNAGLLDRLPPTAADTSRAAQYQQERLRVEQGKAAPSPEAYLSKLGVKVSIFAPAPSDVPRLAQLVAKTNQFNLNCRRRSDVELTRICADASYLVRLAQARDDFGDYGVVGAFIVKLDSDRADLDTFLLSCRAMGRGIEEAMVANLFDEVSRASIERVFAVVEEHPRNEPARRFFAGLGCDGCGIAGQLRRVVWPSYVENL